MESKQVWKRGDVKVNKITKEVIGQGEVTQYTVNQKQANAFGVQWTQLAYFETKREAVNYAKSV